MGRQQIESFTKNSLESKKMTHLHKKVIIQQKKANPGVKKVKLFLCEYNTYRYVQVNKIPKDRFVVDSSGVKMHIHYKKRDRESTDSKGSEYYYAEVDRSYVPPGAVKCETTYYPYGYYTNTNLSCIQCEEDFTFDAAEQKFWYETLEFHYRSIPNRCPDCRKQKRAENSLKANMDHFYELYTKNPKDVLTMLHLARAICLHYEKFQIGNLDLAISLARKVKEMDKNVHEGSYWEGAGLYLSNHYTKALKSLEKFNEEVESNDKYRELKSSSDDLIIHIKQSSTSKKVAEL